MPLHVLLVEPDAGLADEIRRAFSPLGFSVTALSAGEGVLERCKESPPDLILLAAELPDMSGFSVCNRLKRTLSSVPLVLYTAEATEAAIDAHRATRTHADDYLKKPFEVADLLARAAALLHADQPGPPPPPTPPRPDGRRASPPGPPPMPGVPAGAATTPPPVPAPGGGDPPVLQRVDSGQIAARGLAALQAAQAAPPARPSRPGVPAQPAPAAAGGPPAIPPPVPPRPGGATLGRIKAAGPARDPLQVLDEWPRDPAPPKGTPEEKLEYFRDRLRARDAFLAKVRDAFAEARGIQAELAGERDGLQHDLELERDRALGLEGRLQEAAQDAAAQAARIEDLRRQLEESETTRQSLSDVLNETMQANEASEQQWAARIAQADADRVRLEAQLADQSEGHARAVAALEADRADERARAEQARTDAEDQHAAALAAEQADRGRERDEAAGKLTAAEERIAALGAERDQLQAELVKRDEEHRARIGALMDDLAARSRAHDDEAASLKGQLDEAARRGEALEAQLADARGRVSTLEQEAIQAGQARAALEQALTQAHAEARAYDEKAVATEHAFHAKVAELAASEQRIQDLGRALDEGRATAEGTRGELTRVDAARADAERRAAQLQAERDQLGREVETARRETEAARDEGRAHREYGVKLHAEVQRLAKLEPIADEAVRLRKEVASLREMVQQRTQAAEGAARAAQGAAAERARAEERLAVEGGRLVAQVSRLEQDVGTARRKIEELQKEAAAREAALRKAGQEAEERRRATVADAGESEKRHAAEAARLKSAMVELERHLEARARAELTMKKRIQELERTAPARGVPVAATDPALVAQLKAQLTKLSEELQELRGENDFLNGEVARYVQKNKDLLAQLASLRES